METKYYTLAEIADLIKVTRRTLYNHVKNGKLKATKPNGMSGWRVTQTALDEFLNTRN